MPSPSLLASLLPTSLALAASLGPFIPRSAHQDSQTLQRLQSLPDLAEHPLVVDRTVTSALWINEVGEKAESAKGAQLRDALVPWIVAIEEKFTQRISAPLGVARSPEFPRLQVLALGSASTRAALADRAEQRSGEVGWHGYEQSLDVVICDLELDPLKPSPARDEFLRGCVLALFDDHETPATQRNSPPVFVLEGVAAYLGNCAGHSPADLVAPRLGLQELEPVMMVFGTPPDALAPLYSLNSLLKYRTRDEFELAAEGFAKEQKAPAPDLDAAYAKLSALCGLWVHYLHDAEEGRFRRGLFTYLKSVFNGDPSALRLRVALGLKELESMDESFKAWASARYRVLGGSPNIESALSAAALMSQNLLPKSSSFDAVRMAVASTDFGARHAGALSRAHQGDLDGCASALDELVSGAKAYADLASIELDRTRVHAYLELRNAWIDATIQKATKVGWNQGGKKFSAAITAREASKLLLGPNSAKLGELKFTEIDPLWLAGLIPADVATGEMTWKRMLPYALTNDAKLVVLKRNYAPANEALVADAQSRYPQLLAEGAVAAQIAELAAAGLPQDRAAGELCLDRLHKLMASGRTHALVRARLELINGLAAGAAEQLFDAKAHLESMGATASDLGEGRWKLSWSFDKPEEIAAFRLEPGYLQGLRGDKPELKLFKDTRKLQVLKGALRSQGQHLLRLRPEFVSPFTLRIAFAFGGVPRGGSDLLDVEFGICDDQRGNVMVLDPWGNISVYDPSGNPQYLVQAKGTSPVRIDRPYAVEVIHDGKQVTLKVDDATVNTVDCKSRTSGSALVFFHSDSTAALPSFEAEGLLDLAALQRDHLYEVLVSLGLF